MLTRTLSGGLFHFHQFSGVSWRNGRFYEIPAFATIFKTPPNGRLSVSFPASSHRQEHRHSQPFTLPVRAKILIFRNFRTRIKGDFRAGSRFLTAFCPNASICHNFPNTSTTSTISPMWLSLTFTAPLRALGECRESQSIPPLAGFFSSVPRRWWMNS